MKKVRFDVQGMTCSSCSSHVEKAVSKLEGVEKVAVNLLSNNMVVEYEETKTSNDEIIQAVIDAGYGATLVEKEKSQKKEQRPKEHSGALTEMKRRLITSICFLIPLMYLAMHHMFYEWLGLPVPVLIREWFHGAENAISFVFTQLLLLLPIVVVNRNYFVIGFKRLIKKAPNMDSLIAIGSSAAILYGIFAIYQIGYGFGHENLTLVDQYAMNVYFESAGTILTLITLGKYLEAKSKGKTGDAIQKLMNLAPKTAIVVREDKQMEIPIEEIIVGDTILIKPGASIPVDGVILQGSSSIDQSSMTGESVPVSKSVGDSVISGTINKQGSFTMRATKVGNNTTLSQIIQLVEEASNSKAPIAKLADRVSGIFVPCVIAIAIVATLFWLLQGQSIEFALNIGIAVLVISCPCALGLATPVAIMVGTGKGAENGILIKSAESLELLHSIDTIVLDKTGTITEGKPRVTDILSLTEEAELLKVAGSLEKNSEHPLAEAILQEVEKRKIRLVEIEEFASVPGRGVKGILEGVPYIAGNLIFMQENGMDTKEIEIQSKSFLQQGKTVIYFADQSKIIGMIAIADTIKHTTYQAIRELQKRDLEIIMLTGDHQVVAETIGKKLGINQVISEVLPQEKEKEVEKLQQKGKKVAFVGDGINDSPALVKAEVGIAIGSGTDIAMESADIVLIRNSLLDVVTAIDLSKAVIKNIKMNLFWAFFYNAIGIPIAAGVFYHNFGITLNPMIGAAAMSLSSVCVVTNALRLRRFKSNIEKETNQKGVKQDMKTVIIEGMQCNHCKMSVEKTLGKIEGITKVEVSLEEKLANIESDSQIDNTKIIEAIEEAGFEVKEIR